MKIQKEIFFRKNLVKKLLLFIIYPFAAYLLSLKDFKSRSSRYIFYFWLVLFGFTFMAVDKSADSYGYAHTEFEQVKSLSISQFTNIIKDYFTFHSNTKDIYVLTCNFLVSRITDNYHFLFALFAMVFAFFYLKSFKFLTENQNFSYTVSFYFLAFMFIFSNPIYNINGMRFYTAAWIAVYALFHILVKNNWGYLILIIITPFIHVSFIILIPLLPFIFVSKRFSMFWIIMFFISFFVSGVKYIDTLFSFQSYYPDIINNMINNYFSDESFSERLRTIAELPLYARILNAAPYIYINSLMTILIIHRKKILKRSVSFKMFEFVLCWLTIFNIIGISSMGRFITLSIPLLVYLWVSSNPNFIKKFNWAIYIMPLAYSYDILHWARGMIVVTDPLLFIMNPIYFLIKNL